MIPVVSPLEQLLVRLETLSGPLEEDELGECLRGSPLTLEQLQPWLRFDDQVYCRNRIAKLPHVELLLLCWRSGQLTAIHDHAGSACAVKVLAGTATEIAYSRSDAGFLFPTTTTVFAEGSLISSYDDEIHQLGNLAAAGSPLVTLHAYSPPLSNFQIYDESRTFFAGYQKVYSTVASALSGEGR